MAIDILDVIAIELLCVSCGGHYEVTLRQVLVYEQILHEGCPVPSQYTNECPPLFFANLIERDLILELERVWHRLEEQIPATGGTLVMRKPQNSSRLDSPIDET